MTESDSNWFSDETSTFGDRLAGARDHARLEQKELARKIGVDLETLQAWEDDHREPRANRLQMLTGMLGVSVGWLLTGVGEGPDSPEQGTLTPDATAILDEMRELKVKMTEMAARMSVLDKRLRKVLVA